MRFDTIQKLLERLEVFPRREQMQIARVLNARKQKKDAPNCSRGPDGVAIGCRRLLHFWPPLTLAALRCDQLEPMIHTVVQEQPKFNTFPVWQALKKEGA